MLRSKVEASSRYEGQTEEGGFLSNEFKSFCEEHDPLRTHFTIYILIEWGSGEREHDDGRDFQEFTEGKLTSK